MHMAPINMTYNSEREDIIISEYGRIVQNMIEQAKAIPDREKRQATVERIIELMVQLFPQSKSVDDYRLKIWKHVMRISRYELDVTPPEGVATDPEMDKTLPAPLAYPGSSNKFRHYGAHVQQLIQRALAMESGPIKDEFVRVIASYMKLAYRTWNKEHFVSDDVIKDDLKMMSGGALEVHESTALNDFPPQSIVPANRKRKRNPGNMPQGGQNGGHRRPPHHKHKRR
jgi:hypothetical protein